MDKETEELVLSNGGGEEGFTRRQFTKRAGALALGIVAADLAPLTPASAAVPRGAKLASAARVLTIASPYVTPNVDRELNNSDQNEQEFNMQCVEPLIEWRKKLRPDGNFDLDFSGYVPVLALKWEITDGGRSIIWHLRPGVKSPAGNELTAEVIKWNVAREFGITGSIGSFQMSILGIDSADQVKVLSKYSVQLTAKTPSSLWLNIQPQHTRGPLDMAEYMAHATKDDPWAMSWGRQNVVGFGPYQLESLVPGQKAVFIQNPHYWRRSATFPNFDQLVFEEVPDPTIRASLLTSGSVDIAKSLSFRQLATLKGVKINDFKQSSNQDAWTIQTQHPVLKDVRVRQALAYAIPYEQLLKEVYYGFAAPAYGSLVEFSPTLDKSLWPYKLDLGKSKELLKAAGHSDGFTFKFSYPIGLPEDATQALLFQSALEPLGIKVELEQLTPAALNTEIFTFKHDVALFHGGSNDPDPFYSFYLYFIKQSVANLSQYSNPQVQSLVAAGLTSQNTKTRTADSQQVQRDLDRDLPFLWVAEPGVQFPSRTTISGMFPRMTRELVYADLTKK